MNIITLSNAHLTLDLLPELGASVLNFRAASGRPVLRPVELADVKTSSQCGSFSLMPYSNRIRGARFSFGGREVQLTPSADGNIQHGDVRNRPWQVQAQGADHLACTFDSRDFVGVNWPWAFTARVEYRLEGAELALGLSLSNADRTPMPAGMGRHPYFARQDGGVDPQLGFTAGGVYVTDGSFIPTAVAVAVPPALDFGTPRPVGTQELNHGYADWNGLAVLDWGTRRLSLRADPLFSHLVVFTAPDGSLALEPVTHATDAFNLAGRGVPGVDRRVLEPGETLAGGLRLSLEGAW